ncbi:hypothetical protein [Aquibacillus saliphilus]|uniref:hypothetical protein n=1 Tax=Aquibacillus saliphilus TaxID=1909422 RepID=UPI001CF08370|nr:hypothetical protein [Aquibacillus saliphilus]
MGVLKTKKVNTRKTHDCHGCGHSYPAKTKMRYVVSQDGGDIYSSYYCKTCDEVLDKIYDYVDLDNGIIFGSVKDWDMSLWEDIHLKYK